jgi:hypothetical protein
VGCSRLAYEHGRRDEGPGNGNGKALQSGGVTRISLTTKHQHVYFVPIHCLKDAIRPFMTQAREIRALSTVEGHDARAHHWIGPS